MEELCIALLVLVIAAVFVLCATSVADKSTSKTCGRLALGLLEVALKVAIQSRKHRNKRG